MGNFKSGRRFISFILAFVLVLSQAGLALGASIEAADTGSYEILEQEDFQDGTSLGGFVAGGGASASNKDDGSGDYYLETKGSGSGTRSIVKALTAPTAAAQVYVSFDWKPEAVTTAANSSEILFTDTAVSSSLPDGTPLFRLVKGGDGKIRYGVGTTGIDLSATETVTGITYDGSWLSVQVLFDFAEEQIAFEIHDRDQPANSFSVNNLDIGTLNYVNSIAKLIIRGNRAGGQALSFTTGLDNLMIKASAAQAPAQGASNIASIQSAYKSRLTVFLGTALADVISVLPPSLDVLLENGNILPGVSVVWSSDGYNPDQAGTYSFTGALNVSGINNVKNDNNIQGAILVQTVEASAVPEVEGFVPVYYTDFGDVVAETPLNWGFTTANAALGTPDAEVGGNATPKLSFYMENQSGGRVATKTLDSMVTGSRILIKFDWYPGEINDKGDPLKEENGGDFRIVDSSNNIVLTLNYTRNSPLAFYRGNFPKTATGFTNPLAWYAIEVLIDQSNDQAVLKITDKETGVTEEHELPLDDIAFDGFIHSIRLVGVRTAGNNITWRTYLDNVGIYHVPIADNWVIKTNKLLYKTVYVNEATGDASTIGLPESVEVTLANKETATVTVTEWTASGKAWEPSATGIYKFEGTIDTGEELVNGLGRKAVQYVYNRLKPPENKRQTEWLDRGVVALQAEEGIFVSWRLLADEYASGITFNLYRNGVKLNEAPLAVTNYADASGAPGDLYRVETLVNGAASAAAEAAALDNDYLSIPLQRPEGGTTATGSYTYHANDASVGDLDGDGQYEIIIKWYPSNAIDSSQSAMTGPTLFDAYKLDGTLLWRMDMGLNLTSGAHYNQFIVADFDGDGKSEMMIKTADATTVYGVTDGVFDPDKVISVIGNPEDNGRWVNDQGHVYGGPEYMTVFEGTTGKAIDTIDYAYPVGEDGGLSWGDTWFNRSDRFLAGLAYLDGVKPSAVFGRGYYERTTFAAYSLVNGKLVEEWTFDSKKEGRGDGLGFHSLATADVDNDGKDEIIAGSLTLDDNGKILYAMDGAEQRELGSHGDALHVGAFDPNREGLQVYGVHEVPAVASMEYHDAATGETLMAFYASKDTGRGLAANITSSPGYEFWGTAGTTVETGGAVYNVQNRVENPSYRDAGLSVNFALYWDGDLLHELLNGVTDDNGDALAGGTTIDKYNETTGKSELVKRFEEVVSNNGTKGTPSLQADILGDWREEVILPTADSTELRIFSTTIPTEYTLYTLMHDPVYRNAVAWQNTAYNQPPHISFYLGEDIRDAVLARELPAPQVQYTNAITEEEDSGGPVYFGYIPSALQKDIVLEDDGSVTVIIESKWHESAQHAEAALDSGDFASALNAAKADASGLKKITLDIAGEAEAYQIQLPLEALQAAKDSHVLAISTNLGRVILRSAMLGNLQADEGTDAALAIASVKPEHAADRKVLELSLLLDGKPVDWNNSETPVRIAVPYEPASGEDAELLSVTRLEDGEARTPVFNGRHDSESGAVVFAVDQFGMFAVSYAPKTFGDIQGHPWAQKQIEVLASKGIIAGTSDELHTFDPDSSVTRADFTVLLVRALGLRGEADSGFKDVHPEDYYYQAVGIAKRLGIAQGQAEGAFNPKERISRQDMMVLTARAIEAAGFQLNSGAAGTADPLAAFADKGEIAGYARESVAGLVSGKLIAGYDGGIHPLGNATRAETAVLMYRIYMLP